MPHGRRERWRRLLVAVGMVLVVIGPSSAGAAGPRWVMPPTFSGPPPYVFQSENFVIWYTDQPVYYTDPGDLSAWVNHAAADAMVAAAAGVWNVPTSRIVVQQGGTLDEQVSGGNVYAGPDGLVFPADVQSSNYAAKQIAVIYDRDGSVTDLLLGGGASDPSECLQNAVTESVDSITAAGKIQHAVLILNGRCTGVAPEQQLQMQYQLERAFGRILGLGWSQLNDNVFTGTPQPTLAEAQNWPIMHPIDVVCGPYTYQCLPQPFTLRPDDVASITTLYPVTSSSAPAGKQPYGATGSEMEGKLYFPTGQGMAGMNILLRRNKLPEQLVDAYDAVSVVSGALMQEPRGNPITPNASGQTGSETSPYYDVSGYFRFFYIPVAAGHTTQDVLLRTEAINPLYTGQYAVGPYTASTVAPSGNSVTWRRNGLTLSWGYPYFNAPYQLPVPNAASTCATSGDGTETTPSHPASGGWWNGLICAAGHTAWTGLTVQANRSLTVEVTALDEQGLATVSKARPVLGVWGAADAIGSLPGVAAAPTAFNSVDMGMTTLTTQSTLPNTFRIAIAEERGDGRPDYSYQARVLYADTIAPAVSSYGTTVTITGMGFRPGNTVTINGVTAKVSSWTATTIVATVPFLSSVALGTTATVDVAVTDLSTNGTTVMTGAFQYVYTAPVYTLSLVSGPSGNLPVGLVGPVPFAVKALDVDGVTPLAGVPIDFSAVSGGVSWGACGAASCTVLTDATGLASTTVTPTAVGAVTLQAAGVGQVQQVSFQAVPLVRSVTVSPLVEYLAAGATVSWMVVAELQQQGTAPAAGTAVNWASASASAAMTLSSAQTGTDAQGATQVTATAGPLVGGVQATGSACAWGTVCATFTVLGVDPSQFVVVLMSGAGQSVASTGTLGVLTVQITDQAGDPVVGAAVQIHQTVEQWTPPCPPLGRCPVAPVYEASVTSAVSDAGGMVTVTPLQISGAEVTNVVVTSGPLGFVSLTLEKQP